MLCLVSPYLEYSRYVQVDHQALLKKVSNKDQLVQQNEAMSKLIDVKKQNVMKMTNTGLSLKERANEFIVSCDMADSRTAYAISLYAKISNITWDYKAPQGRLAGCMSRTPFVFTNLTLLIRHWKRPKKGTAQFFYGHSNADVV